MSEKFRCLIRVRYGDCDAQGVVFNARYGDYVDVASTEYQRFTVGGYQAVLDAGIDFQAVKLSIEWKASARFDEVLAIEVETAHLGNTSYGLGFSMYEHYSNKLLATAQTVYVCVDGQSFEKKRIPDSVRAQLQDAATGVLVNQAGITLDGDR